MEKATALLMVLLVATLSLSGCLRNGERRNRAGLRAGTVRGVDLRGHRLRQWPRPHGNEFGIRASFVET